MLKISYTPSEYCFTPDLPTEIAISTDATAIDITVECDGNAAFTTTLYPYNNTATLYDIRSVIESYLLSRNLIFTRFVILAEVTDADGKITENTNSLKFKYKYAATASRAPSSPKPTSSTTLSTAPSTNPKKNLHAIHPHLHPPQNPLVPRTRRHPSMDAQRRDPVLASLHLPQI